MLSASVVRESVEKCLESINDPSNNHSFRYRLAAAGDAEDIMRLVKGLAVYEKEPDAVNVTVDTYRCDGGSEEPLFYCVLLEDAKAPVPDGGGKPYCCGMAFFYFGCELGSGRFLYLEDLYIEEAYRKRGGGSLTMKTMATIGLALGCQHFDWVALDWNTPALSLYEKIGANVQKGTLVVRYTDDKLRRFASS